MRIFNEPNTSSNWKCPICNSDKKKPVILAGVSGTFKDGVVEAEQIHVDCIELTIDKSLKKKIVLYQVVMKGDKKK